MIMEKLSNLQVFSICNLKTTIYLRSLMEYVINCVKYAIKLKKKNFIIYLS